MRKEDDFSRAKRPKDVPHLARLQAEAKGKTRITIMLDNFVSDVDNDDNQMIWTFTGEGELEVPAVLDVPRHDPHLVPTFARTPDRRRHRRSRRRRGCRGRRGRRTHRHHGRFDRYRTE